jgi:lambda repressor-like predicted transcriptional regulator
MAALEARMRRLGTTIDAALRETRGLVSATATSEAAQAWAEYQRIMAEVLRLSRLNTNVISFDVSVHEKRTATRACLDAIAGLRSAIESGPHATR